MSKRAFETVGKSRAAEILRLFNGGVSRADLASRFGLTPRVVSNMMSTARKELNRVPSTLPENAES